MITRSLLTAWTGRPPLTLLVDRDSDTRKMYGEYLQLSSCLVDEAEDGREALAKALARHPDVIVSETRLPGISGFELCRLLRQDPATQSIPIVLVTGDAFPRDLELAQSVGATAVLVKPCLPEALLAEMHRVLDQSVGLRARATAVRGRLAVEIAKSERAVERSRGALNNARRTMLSRAHNRRFTTEPPTPAPALVCPQCDQPLCYQRSHIGGVSERHMEQWDYYECASGCGNFQYRQRTRKLRKV